MHVRPVVIVAILAAAAGASAVRLGGAAGSPPFATSSNSATPSESGAGFATGSSSPDHARFRSVGGGEHSATGSPSSRDERSPPRTVVYVAGDVRRPGVYALAADARVVDALRAAGGPTADADPVAVDLAAHVEDGQEIAVPSRGSAAAASVPGDDDVAPTRKRGHARRHRRRKHARRTAADAAAETVTPVDVNTADGATLATLPGIGPGLAERIVAFRSLNGPFASADELLDVGGLTASEVDRLAPSLVFGADRERTSRAGVGSDDPLPR